MAQITVCHGKIIEAERQEFPTHTFQLVNEVPPGYFVWNIGSHNMPSGYLPLCRKAQRVDAGEYGIDGDSLKAIRIDGAGKILDAIGGGQGTVKSMERYIERYKNAQPGTWSYRQVQRMKEALPIMRKIKGLEG